MIFKKIKSYFDDGHERSVLAKKNILQLILLKGLGVVISFLIVPLTINYVNSDSYGVWLTLSSTVAWISLFDAGINNGLRNKLSEALASKDYDSARGYISTTYIVLTLIFIPLFLIFIFINNYINWADLINCAPELAIELNKVMIIIFGYFSLRFILSTVNIVFLANQNPAGASFWNLMEQIVSLSCIYILTLVSKGSLFNLSIGLCVAPILVLILSNVIIFNTKFRQLKPEFRFYGTSYAKKILSLGLKFFIIQIAGIIQFQSSNFIIINAYGPSDVTIFNIVYKYFSIISMGMNIIITPLWSAVSNAYFMGDEAWIINCVNKYQKVGIALFFFGLILLTFSQTAYEFWLGKSFAKIPFQVSAWMFLFSVTTAIGSIYVGVMNGINALKIQFIATLISPIIFLFSCFILIKVMHFGISAVIIASIIGNYNGIILAPLQYYKVFVKKSYNPIWRSR